MKMMKTKTIFLVPVYNCEDILEDWSKYIRRLDPKPEKVIFAENNSSDNTLNILLDLDVGTEKEIIRFWTIEPREIPFSQAYDIIAHARQLLLTRARQLDPDYAIFIDSDILIKSPDFITSLTDWKVDIVGGAYLRWFPEGLHVASLWKKGHYKPWRLYTPQGFKALNKAIQEVYATSGGCLCLSRKVIQDRRANFYPIPKGFSEDFGYCEQLKKVGYKVWLDGITILTHRIRGKWKSWNLRREKEETRKEYDKKR